MKIILHIEAEGLFMDVFVKITVDLPVLPSVGDTVFIREEQDEELTRKAIKVNKVRPDEYTEYVFGGELSFRDCIFVAKRHFNLLDNSIHISLTNK